MTDINKDIKSAIPLIRGILDDLSIKYVFIHDSGEENKVEVASNIPTKGEYVMYLLTAIAAGKDKPLLP
jgi:hypothetical protein